MARWTGRGPSPKKPVLSGLARIFRRFAQVAQSVEQRTENPRVGGSIPPLGTISPFGVLRKDHKILHNYMIYMRNTEHS